MGTLISKITVFGAHVVASLVFLHFFENEGGTTIMINADTYCTIILIASYPLFMILM